MQHLAGGLSKITLGFTLLFGENHQNSSHAQSWGAVFRSEPVPFDAVWFPSSHRLPLSIESG